MTDPNDTSNEHLIRSTDPLHPANHICALCRQFYTQGWVTGTGGGISMLRGDHIFLAPSGVEKELMRPEDIFVMDATSVLGDGAEGKRLGKESGWGVYLRMPRALKPSACTPLFLSAYTQRNATCCIHTHSQWAVLVTLLCEAGVQDAGAHHDVFQISRIEQIKGISRGGTGSTEIAEGGRKLGNLGYFDTLRIPIIENTAHEEDLQDTLTAAMRAWPETCAVLVRRHGVYVWGGSVTQAKTQCESLDYLFRLAVEMHSLGLKWI